METAGLSAGAAETPPPTITTSGENRRIGHKYEEWAREYLGCLFHEIERVGDSTRGDHAYHGLSDTFDLLCDGVVKVEVKACQERIVARHEKCGTRPGRWHFNITKDADFYLLLVYDAMGVRYTYFVSREKMRQALLNYIRQGEKVSLSSRVWGRRFLRVGLKKVGA